MTLRLEADAVFTVDTGDTVLAPGAVEIDDGLISWVGDPWQVPPASGTEVRRLGGLLMPGLVNCHGHSPMTLLRSAGDGLPLERWLHEAVWPREARLEDEDVYWGMLLGAAELLGNGVTTTCEQYRHPDGGGRGRARGGHPHRVHAGHLRRARRRSGEQLGGAAGGRLRGGRRRRRGRTSGSRWASGRTPPTRCRPEGLRGHRRRGAGARRVAADPPVRDGGRVRGGAGALRHERAGAPGLRGGPRGPGAGGARGVARRRRPGVARRARRGRGALPGLQREAGLGHRPAARACSIAACGSVWAPTARPPTTTSTCGTSCGWPAPRPGHRRRPGRPELRRGARAWPPAAAGRRSASRWARSRWGGRPISSGLRTDDARFTPALSDAELLGHLVWAGAGYLVTDVWVGGAQVVEEGRCTTVDGDRARAEVGQRARRLLGS